MVNLIVIFFIIPQILSLLVPITKNYFIYSEKENIAIVNKNNDKSIIIVPFDDAIPGVQKGDKIILPPIVIKKLKSLNIKENKVLLTSENIEKLKSTNDENINKLISKSVELGVNEIIILKNESIKFEEDKNNNNNNYNGIKLSRELSNLEKRKWNKNRVIPKDVSIINDVTQNSKIKEIYNYIKTAKIPESRIYTLAPNNPNVLKTKKNNQFVVASEFSSGRLELWRKTLNLFTNKNELENIFLGFGSSADRFFLKESVSNAIFYSLISGGYIGLFFLILFYFYILQLFLFFFINKKKYSKDLMAYSSIIIIIFLMFRSLVESSFLMFGSDNIILFICLSYLNNKRLI